MDESNKIIGLNYLLEIQKYAKQKRRKPLLLKGLKESTKYMKDIDEPGSIINDLVAKLNAYGKIANTEELELVKYQNDFNMKEFNRLVKENEVIDCADKTYEKQLDYGRMGLWIKTLEDAKYLQEMVNENAEDVVFLSRMASSIYKKYTSALKGEKELTDGELIFLYAMLGVGDAAGTKEKKQYAAKLAIENGIKRFNEDVEGKFFTTVMGFLQ